jgi:hypothetical protein
LSPWLSLWRAERGHAISDPMMRSSQALSMLGALCVIFGLGIAGYQMVMPEAVSKSTSIRPTNMTEGYPAVRRAQGGLIILGVGAVMMLAGAAFERRSR